ncbi:MAG: DUF6586 family protein [Marinobacter sp.]|uniref:DUF6586 family protein n=1 Tax=Marinobacter sp. TaxID=50741 RepID=UPI00299E38F9|nr:DUF6586 family protein [Marinobacter sp.]MDX1757591.1 DUF6586 family protein [Marinobacter sp.]
MSSQWFTQVSQKLYLARTLLNQQETSDNPVGREAANQGAIELALRARTLLLAMVAELYQHKGSTPRTLAELSALLGPDAPEAVELSSLARQSGSWWSLLDQLDSALAQPPAKKKSVSDDNIIAIVAESGPDRSVATIEQALTAMKQYANSLSERHQEW